MKNNICSQESLSLLAPSSSCPVDPPGHVVSLPLDQLNNQPETPGPMSVLEWRRTVWFQVQSIHHTSNHQAPARIEKSDLPCRTSQHWMFKDPSTNSDSGDELLDGPRISRPLRLKSHQTTGRNLNTVPLIDLTQPTDADGRPIQFEDGRAKPVAQSNKPKKRTMAAPPDIEQRHREAIRRLQAEATEHIIHAEWEAAHQRSTTHLDTPKLHKKQIKRAPLQKLSDFARKSVPNFSARTTAVESLPASGAHLDEPFRATNSNSLNAGNHRTGAKFFKMINKIGPVKRSPKYKKMCSLDSEGSSSRKSLLSSLQFTASNPALRSS